MASCKSMTLCSRHFQALLQFSVWDVCLKEHTSFVDIIILKPKCGKEAGPNGRCSSHKTFPTPEQGETFVKKIRDSWRDSMRRYMKTTKFINDFNKLTGGSDLEEVFKKSYPGGGTKGNTNEAKARKPRILIYDNDIFWSGIQSEKDGSYKDTSFHRECVRAILDGCRERIKDSDPPTLSDLHKCLGDKKPIPKKPTAKKKPRKSSTKSSAIVITPVTNNTLPNRSLERSTKFGWFLRQKIVSRLQTLGTHKELFRTRTLQKNFFDFPGHMKYISLVFAHFMDPKYKPQEKSKFVFNDSYFNRRINTGKNVTALKKLLTDAEDHDKQGEKKIMVVVSKKVSSLCAKFETIPTFSEEHMQIIQVMAEELNAFRYDMAVKEADLRELLKTPEMVVKLDLHQRHDLSKLTTALNTFDLKDGLFLAVIKYGGRQLLVDYDNNKPRILGITRFKRGRWGCIEDTIGHLDSKGYVSFGGKRVRTYSMRIPSCLGCISFDGHILEEGGFNINGEYSPMMKESPYIKDSRFYPKLMEDWKTQKKC